MSNAMKDLTRFSLPLQSTKADAGQWPPPNDQFVQLHFQKSDKPGYVQIFYGGEWYETPGILLINGLFTICPVDTPPKTPINPLRPIRN